MARRIPYIDTAKGILVVLVVFHHIVNVARGMMDTCNMEWIKLTDVLYVPFFMQAFFFITGYCTSFNKDFSAFLVSSLKTLGIPLIVFACINQAVESVVSGRNFFFVQSYGHKVFFLFELYWFLPALLIAKLLVYGCLKITSVHYRQFLIVCILLLVGIFLIGNPAQMYFNYFHWHNALCSTIFLWFGYYFRQRKLLEGSAARLSPPAFFIPLVMLVVYDKLVPYYTATPHFNLKYAPLYVYLAFTGTLMLLTTAQNIKAVWIVNFYGKNSIVVYGLHFPVLVIVETVLQQLLSINNQIQGLSFYLIVGVVTMLLCYVACILFQKKPLNYLVGRF